MQLAICFQGTRMVNGWNGVVVEWDKKVGKGVIQCHRDEYVFELDSVLFEIEKIQRNLSVIFNKKLGPHEDQAINIRLEEHRSSHRNQGQPVHTRDVGAKAYVRKLLGRVIHYDEISRTGIISYNKVEYNVSGNDILGNDKRLKAGWNVVFVPEMDRGSRVATFVNVKSRMNELNGNEEKQCSRHLVSRIYNSPVPLDEIKN